MNTKRIVDMFALLLIGSMYCWALAKSILVSTVLVVDDWELLFLIVSFLVFFAVLFYNRITMFVALGVTVSAYFYFAYQFFWVETPNEQLLLVYETAIQSLQFARGYIPHEEIYTTTILYVICFLLTFCASIFIYAGFNFFMLTAIAAVLIMLNLMSLFPIPDLAYIVFLFSYLLLMAKKLHKFNPVMIGLTAISLLIATIIPTPSLTKGESTEGLYDVIYDYVRPKYFSFQSTGFTPSDRKLGGTARPNSGYVMDVYTDERVYLAGSTKNFYTGYSWEKEHTEMFLYDESMYFSEQMDRNEKYGNVEIHIGNNRTSTIFRPIRTTGVSFPYSDQTLYTDRYGNLQTEEFLPRGSSYTVRYLMEDYWNWWEKFYQYEEAFTIHEGEISDYNEEQVVIENGHIAIAPILEIQAEEIRLHSDGTIVVHRGEFKEFTMSVEDEKYSITQTEKSIIHTRGGLANAVIDFVRRTVAEKEWLSIDNSIYLNLPDELPERVIQLAQEITSPFERDYDKVKAIEGYLRKNYDYTLSPAQVPEGDFVDHFLFEGKEGYCTYYASALAVMARTLGIPSRYVEGFILPETKNSAGGYTVTNAQAHAWAEVYLQGFGWTLFEATPPYQDALQGSYLDTEEDISSVLSSQFEEPEEVPLIDQSTAEEQEQPEQPEQIEQQSEPNRTDAEVVAIKERTMPIFVPLLGAVCLIVFSLMALIAVNFARRNWQDKRMKRLSARESAIQYFRLFMEAASFLGYSPKENETSLQYANRVSYSLETIALRDAEKIFSKAKYGKNEITETEWQRVQAIYLDIHALLRAKYAKPKWFYYRYILYKF